MTEEFLQRAEENRLWLCTSIEDKKLVLLVCRLAWLLPWCPCSSTFFVSACFSSLAGSPATSSGCGSTPMQQMPQQPQQMQQQPQQMQQQPQQMQQQPQQMQQQPQQMQQQQQSQQMQQQQQSQQMQLQAFLMPGHCGAQAREVNGGTPPGSIQTETKNLGRSQGCLKRT